MFGFRYYLNSASPSVCVVADPMTLKQAFALDEAELFAVWQSLQTCTDGDFDRARTSEGEAASGSINMARFLSGLEMHGALRELDARLSGEAGRFLLPNVLSESGILEQSQAHAGGVAPCVQSQKGEISGIAVRAMYDALLSRSVISAPPKNADEFLPALSGLADFEVLSAGTPRPDIRVLMAVHQFFMSGAALFDEQQNLIASLNALVAKGYPGWMIDGLPVVLPERQGDYQTVADFDFLVDGAVQANKLAYVLVRIIRCVWKRANAFEGGLKGLSAILSGSDADAGNRAAANVVVQALVDVFHELDSIDTSGKRAWLGQLQRIACLDEHNPLPYLLRALEAIGALVDGAQSAPDEMSASVTRSVLGRVGSADAIATGDFRSILMCNGESVVSNTVDGPDAAQYMLQRKMIYNQRASATLGLLWESLHA